MSNSVIKVENLGKQYHLGIVGTGTVAHDLNRWWYRVRGKEDPYLKIGDTNDRTTKGSDIVWALKDINFEVQRGDVLGIIGRNGAGKSTLLKILSRVTVPSVGSIKAKGRIASLLEVGTGFHPELTGRENIFLNGAILGMTKYEIKKRFDEIVSFSGVDRYIDTPVKRYSSGMYVRLAFAVAAHLEPEILIIDEVLAVGDAEFQKKCLGKMKDVSGNGRTVLFVSHNMHAVEGLCNRTIYLNQGMISAAGETKMILDQYMNENLKNAVTEYAAIDDYRHRRGNGDVRFTKIEVTNASGELTNEFKTGETIYFKLGCLVLKKVPEILCSIYLKKPFTGEYITHTEKFSIDQLENKEAGTRAEFTISILNNSFTPGGFDLYIWLGNRYQGGAYDIIDGLVPSIRILSNNNKSLANAVGHFYIQTEFKYQ